MHKVILIAGYTKSEYLEQLYYLFPNESVTVACAYSRKPESESKQKYLGRFDVTFDINNEEDVKRLQDEAEAVVCVTCTQERDMETYIKILELLHKITPEQAVLYRSLIHKYDFKKLLAESRPELIPKVEIVNESLMSQLDLLLYPQVVKPSGLAGSTLVRIVENPEEMRTHLETCSELMQSIGNQFYQKHVDIITEEFITGPQYSVNVYINEEGKVMYCPIVRVITPQEVGVNDTYSLFQYTTDELSENEYLSLTESIEKVVERFQISSTSAHFDAVLSNGQWKFFEVGLRIGGNRQKLFSLSHGMNHFLNDIKNRLGIEITIPQQKKTACIVQTGSTTTGILREISYTRVANISKTPLIHEDKLAKIGSELKPVSQGGGTITRHFVAGTDALQVLGTSRDLYDAITFTIDETP